MIQGSLAGVLLYKKSIGCSICAATKRSRCILLLCWFWGADWLVLCCPTPHVRQRKPPRWAVTTGRFPPSDTSLSLGFPEAEASNSGSSIGSKADRVSDHVQPHSLHTLRFLSSAHRNLASPAFTGGAKPYTAPRPYRMRVQ